MFKTLQTHEVQVPFSIRGMGDRYWRATLLPLAEGVLLIDPNFADNNMSCVQPLLCPATLTGISSLDEYKDAIHSIVYIPPPRHDGSGRDDPIAVDTVDFGFDALHDFRDVLLVRDLHGQWHACAKDVDIHKVDDRCTVLQTTAD